MLMEGHHGASTSKDIAATREVLLQTHDQISPLHPKGDLTFLISDDPELWVDARMGISCFSQTAVLVKAGTALLISASHLTFLVNCSVVVLQHVLYIFLCNWGVFQH